jgi:hypothetical protein
MKKFSRVLTVATVAFVANASAHCPIFENKAFNELHKNKSTIANVILADHFCAKNEHFKKAFMVTAGTAMDKKAISANQLGQQLVVDYTIRRFGSDSLDKLHGGIVKNADVLPNGMARDLIKPVVDGAAEVVTHPEFLTYVAMEYVVPMLVSALGGNQGQTK